MVEKNTINHSFFNKQHFARFPHNSCKNNCQIMALTETKESKVIHDGYEF